MDWSALIWAFVSLCAIAAAWDTFYRLFGHRQASALEERVGKVEDDVARALERAEKAEEYARGAANRGPERPNRWVRP